MPLNPRNYFSVVVTLLALAFAMPSFASARGVPEFIIKQTGETTGAASPIPEAVPSPISPTVTPLDPNLGAVFTQWAADPTNFEHLAQLLVVAIQNGLWGLLASILLMLAVVALKRFVPAHTVVGKWLASPPGAAIASLIFSLGLGFGTMFAANVPFSVGMVAKAISMALMASGTWSVGKAVKEWLDSKKAASAGAAASADPGKTLDK